MSSVLQFSENILIIIRFVSHTHHGFIIAQILITFPFFSNTIYFLLHMSWLYFIRNIK